MEHRRAYRLNTNLLARIQNQQFSLDHYHACNISSGGVCIIDNKHRLNKGEFVNLQIKCNDSRHSSSYFMKAIVVYRDGDKAGLMWANYDPNFSYFLQEAASLAA